MAKIEDVGVLVALTSWGWVATTSRECFLLTRCCDSRAELSVDSSTGVRCKSCKQDVATAYADTMPNERLEALLTRYGGPIGEPA